MILENIEEIIIDETGRLCIKPEKEKFDMIYRSATEVHWDNKENFLYSPKPREWSYLDWYKHIVSVIFTEYKCRLIMSPKTKWLSIPDNLRDDMIAFDKLGFDKWIFSQSRKN